MPIQYQQQNPIMNNNVAASSFYSHLPFGQSSGYMSTFGGAYGIRTPMDSFGYGS